jgi:hypothetical protein
MSSYRELECRRGRKGSETRETVIELGFRGGALAIVVHRHVLCSILLPRNAGTLNNPPIPPETDSTISAWMRSHGWNVAAARWTMEPEAGFYVWQEEHLDGKAHALWVADYMVRHLTPDELIKVLNQEAVAEDVRASFKVRIEERGAEYRVSPVPRRSGGFKKLE